MARSNIGGWLVAAALVLALAAVVLWTRESRQADRERQTAVLAGRPVPDEDRTLPLAAAGTAGVLFLGGVILVASNRDQS